MSFHRRIVQRGVSLILVASMAGVIAPIDVAPVGATTPVLQSTRTPANEATNASTTTNLVLVFNIAVTRGTGSLVLHKANGTPAQTFDIAASPDGWGWGTTTITIPLATLTAGTDYFVNYPNTAFLNGATGAVAITNHTSWKFKTAGTLPTPWGAGAGTSINPWQITNCAELLSIDAASAYWDDHYILNNNIDCAGTTVYPMMVGAGSTQFTGSLNGNSKTISNLDITCTRSTQVGATGCGLFKSVSQGSAFSNLTLSSVTINETASTDSNVGSLFGWQSGSSTTAVTITNVTVTGLNITNTLGAFTGGIAGQCATCVLSNVSTAGNITGKNQVGGIFGKHGGDLQTVAATMSNVSSSATISATHGTTSSRQYVGGLVAYYSISSSATTANKTLSNLRFTGSITADGTTIGGLFGNARQATINDAASSGNVTGYRDVGGLFGGGDNLTVTTSQTSGTITGTGSSSCGGQVGGISGYFHASTISKSYSTATVKGFCRLGGLFGSASPTSNATFIQDSYFHGVMQQTNTGTFARNSMGGLVGLLNENSTMARSYAVASSVSYTAPTGSNFQGLVGERTHGKTITCTNLYWDQGISSLTTDGACGTGPRRSTADMKLQATFAGFDFTNDWSIAAGTNGGYPTLRVFTDDTTAPSIQTLSPTDDATNVAVGENLVVTFSENVTAVAGKYVRICTGTASCTGSSVAGDVVHVLEATNAAVTVSGAQVTINPAADLAASTTYYVSIDSGAFRDAAGNDFAGLSAGASWNFTTAVAAPAFTISSSSETTPQDSAISGYTVSSTGGTIASFSISPAAPSGLTFNTSTGVLSGTPTSVQSATTYTITATNAGGTATRSFTLTVTVSCANGGECRVGDVGPGGGVVFYVHAAGGTFTASGAPCDTACRYLEAAPTTGTNAWTDAGYAWSGNTTTLIGVAAQGTGIGTGFANTEAIVTQADGGSTASRAATISRAYRGPNNRTDWYLPSRDELNELCKYANTDSNGLGFNCAAGTQRAGFNFVSAYWNSSETDASNARRQLFANGGVGGAAKSGSNLVRPVRAFGLPAITYDGNGGSGSISPTIAAAGSAVNLSSGAGLSRGGFSLAGWNTASAGGGTSYTASQSVTMPAGGLTLYAQWTADSPTTTAPATTTTTTTTSTTIPPTSTTTSTTSTTSTVPDGAVGINSWTIVASSNPARPGETITIVTTISCGRRMSLTARPYYPSMYYMVRSSPRINGVYRRPVLSDDSRTATFTVTVTAPTEPGTYSMYAYGRDNPTGRTCTGDSFNFAATSVTSLVVGRAVDLATTTTTLPDATTTSVRVPTPEVTTTLPRTTTTSVRSATTSTLVSATTSTPTTTAPSPSTTTPIYEPPVVDPPATTIPDTPPTTIPSRPEPQPEPAFVSTDPEVEAVIQVVDANEVSTGISAQGRLIVNTGSFVRVRGSGFDRAGFAEVWMFSTPRLLGQVPKNAAGNFVGRVRVPDDIEPGEHTIQLRAVTRTRRIVTMAVPAVVIGGAAPTADTSATTTVATDTTENTAGAATTAPGRQPTNLVVTPGATEVVVSTDVVVDVVRALVGPNFDPTTTAVRIRTNVSPWQVVDLGSQSSITLPLDANSSEVEVEATTADGTVFTGRIPVSTTNQATGVRSGLLVVGILLVLLLLFILWRRRRDDDDDHRN